MILDIGWPISMTWLEDLKQADMCPEGVGFAENYNSMRDVWEDCDRGDWLLRYALACIERDRDLADVHQDLCLAVIDFMRHCEQFCENEWKTVGAWSHLAGTMMFIDSNAIEDKIQRGRTQEATLLIKQRSAATMVLSNFSREMAQALALEELLSRTISVEVAKADAFAGSISKLSKVRGTTVGPNHYRKALADCIRKRIPKPPALKI